jgi:hypothetical protein
MMDDLDKDIVNIKQLATTGIFLCDSRPYALSLALIVPAGTGQNYV